MDKCFCKTWWGILLMIIITGLLIYFFMNISKNKNSDDNIDANVLPPKYLSQMEKCEIFGGTIEKQDESVDSWQQLNKWRCVCQEEKIFDTQSQLMCNKWYEPEI